MRAVWLCALLLAPATVTTAEEYVFIADAFSGAPAPALATIRAGAPDGLFLIGDVPHDNPGTNCASLTGCLGKFRAMYQRLYGGVTALGADFKREILDGGVPILGRINDDHEIKDNVSNNFKFWPAALTAFAEAHVLPLDHGLAQGYLYQRLEVPVGDGQALVLLLDVRSHRETTGKKTMLGAAQKTWLAGHLARCADYVWCVLVSPVPVNPHNTKLDSWRGYPADGAWLEAQVAGHRNVLVVSGDCHWGSIALPPLTTLPELNIPQLNAGFSNTGCNDAPSAWSVVSTQAGTGFGRLTLRPTEAVMTLLHADGRERFSVIVPSAAAELSR